MLAPESDGPDSPPPDRAGADIPYRTLDESSDTDVPDYTDYTDAPDLPTAANFAAVLQASRDAANHLRQLETAAPGPSTREAPPPLPNPMDSHLNPDGNNDSDEPVSPLWTRSGTIRVPQAPAKKRKPPNK